MDAPTPPRQALYRLLASAWAPLGDCSGLPWAEIQRLVGRSNLAGLLYSLAAPEHHALPPDVRQHLEQTHYATIAANARTLAQLGALRAALAQVGAPLLLLKGAALTESLYVGLGPRLIGDIDLLVPRAAVPDYRRLLLGMGYTPREAEVRPGAHLAYRYEECFLPPAGAETAVELHWHLLDIPWYAQRMPVDWFWEHSEVRTIAGQPFQVLDDLANLVYLPAHLALHHGYAELHALYDLALLIARRATPPDWNGVVAAARSFELLTPLRETLDRLAECWPSLPLDEPRRRLATLRPSRNDACLCRLLTAQQPSTPQRLYTTLVALPGAGARARYLWHNIFPEPRYMQARYGDGARWHLPYWYAYRAISGLSRYLRALPGMLRPRNHAG